MAIKNLSDIRRLPRLGNIRLGIKVKTKTGKFYPKEVDYFILDPSTPSDEENLNLINEFTTLYGGKPKQIKIMVPLADREKFFPQNYKRYGSSTSLKCIGDGETAICINPEFAKGLDQIGETETGQIRVDCHGPNCIYAEDGKGNKECSAVGILQILLPELTGAGVWQISTGSFHSIVNLNSCLDYITAVCGRFHMLPLILERRPQEILYKGKKAVHYIMQINMNFKLSDIQRVAQIDPSKIMLQLPDVTPVPLEDIADSDGEVPTGRVQELKTPPADSQQKKSDDNKPKGSTPKDEALEQAAQQDPKRQNGSDPGKSDFLNFMVKTRADLKKLTGDDRLYTQEMDAFNVQYPSEVKEEDMKTHMIAHFKSLIEELRKKVNERR